MFNRFGFLAPKDLQIILFSIILALNVPDEAILQKGVILTKFDTYGFVFFTGNKNKKTYRDWSTIRYIYTVELKKYKISNFEQWTPFLSLKPGCNSGVNKYIFFSLRDFDIDK